MIDLTIIPKLVISVICSNIFFQANSIITIVGFLLLIAVVILSFGVMKYKNRAVFLEDDKEKEVRDLNEKLKSKEKEINQLRSMLKKGEAMWENWEDEKEKLNRKIKNLESKIEQYNMNNNKKKKDLIIEYYMNENQ
ncbi:hypothetical protein [Aquipluma nitroreducens]|uniref:hypothetical protein n=1 Tax=Aquipluma nitroreducens TaxID=2010828 RepID=UPI00296FC519|nr:hypothetical protein [Aquipluma nitroreducens]